MNAHQHQHPATSLRGELRHNEPMSKHSSWRCGGSVTRYFEPQDRDDLIAFMSQLAADELVVWLGLGSNLLMRDGGMDCSVISTVRGLSAIRWPAPDLLYAEAGATCARLAREAATHERAGLDFLAGIPGSLGGALRMNAGALGGEIWSFVSHVETLDRDGHVRIREADEFKPRYRGVSGPECWFLSATLALPERMLNGSERIRKVLAARNASQPTGQASCGSVFKNPPHDFAGRLIEQCGLKGRRVGGAVVSDVHANFIVNDGQASAADVEALINIVQQEVMHQCGVEFEAEVVIMGRTDAQVCGGRA